MSPANNDSTEIDGKKIKNFPMKTLLYLFFATIALLILKPEVKQLLSNAEEIEILNVRVKVNRTELSALSLAQLQYDAQIDSLNEKITGQPEQISELEELKQELESNRARNCEELRENARNLSKKFSAILQLNDSISKQYLILKQQPIIKSDFPVEKLKGLTNEQRRKIERARSQ